MATTHLFVELLVIGFGALIWFILLLISASGHDVSHLFNSTSLIGVILPILSIVYVLGILTDRVADWIFEKIWGRSAFEKGYLSPREPQESSADDGEPDPDVDLVEEARKHFFRDRRILVLEAPRLWQFLEYGRSRLRICRGWFLNAVFFILILDVSLLARGFEPQVGYMPVTWQSVGAMHAVAFLSAVISWYSWWRLSLAEYKKTKRQAQWLRDHREKNKTQDVQLSGRLNLGWEEPADV